MSTYNNPGLVFKTMSFNGNGVPTDVTKKKAYKICYKICFNEKTNSHYTNVCAVNDSIKRPAPTPNDGYKIATKIFQIVTNRLDMKIEQSIVLGLQTISKNIRVIFVQIFQNAPWLKKTRQCKKSSFTIFRIYFPDKERLQMAQIFF